MRFRKVAFLAGLLSGATAYSQSFTNTELYYTTHVSGLSAPVAFEWLNSTTMLVNEKVTGKVKIVTNGVYTGDALDLPVSSTGSDEMGLLGLAKDPDFASNNFVYLFYSRATVDAGAWLDDRLVRYTWNGTSLVSPQVLWIMGPTTEFPNPNLWHHGGYLRVGPDEKLYLQRGDMLRFGCMEMNNTPTVIGVAGCIYRLELNGAPAAGNPFIANANDNIKKIWVYGFRNGFGMDWDRSSQNLWFTENGPEVYDEVNVAVPGMNSGWRLIMGPDSRNAAYNNNNNTPHNANELYYLPGATYSDPKFSYLAPIGVAGLAFFGSTRFLESPSVFDNLVMGCTNTGRIYMLPVAADRESLIETGLLADLVADSGAERDLWSIGAGWGGITDARTGPDGYLYLCSWNTGKIQKVRPKSDAVAPFDTNIIRGVASGGNTSTSLDFPDDNRLTMKPGIVFSVGQAPIVLESFGTSPFPNPSDLDFVIEIGASSSSIRQTVELYDFVDQRYEVIDFENVTTSDVRYTISPPAPVSNFVEVGTREMRARISYIATGPIFSVPWQARLDMIHWTCEIP
ncbi:MAG: PQQ-dependent sugar dehydrogenase [Armatimonadota bacterium]|nr:PQQ-dependent sugar dehydrogenase [Armatimonadota bacterium]